MSSILGDLVEAAIMLDYEWGVVDLVLDVDGCSSISAYCVRNPKCLLKLTRFYIIREYRSGGTEP